MFVDRDGGPRPPPWEPRPRPGPRRQEVVLVWLILAGLLAWTVAPIAGVTIFHALPAAKPG